MILCLAPLSGLSLAQTTPLSPNKEGPLPQGKTRGPGKSIRVDRPKDFDPSCFRYLANPESGEFYFSPDGSKVYILARATQADSVSDVMARQRLIAVDLANYRSEIVFEIQSREQMSIVGNGEDYAGLSFLNFKYSTFACGQGYSPGIGIKWEGRNQLLSTFPQAYYKIVRSNKSNLLVERPGNIVRRFDFRSQQRLPPERLPSTAIPLYIDYARSKFFGLQVGERLSLQRYGLDNRRLEAELRLAPNMKLVQQAERFAVVEFDDKRPTFFQVRELDAWTAAGFRRHEYELPKDLVARDARIIFDWFTKTAIVLGRSPSVASEWKHAWVLNPTNKEPEQKASKKADEDSKKGNASLKIDPPANHYIAYANLAPENQRVFFVSKHLDSDQYGSLLYFDIEKKQLNQITVGIPENPVSPVKLNLK